MAKFFKGTTRGVRIAAYGFALALIGAMIGFATLSYEQIVVRLIAFSFVGVGVVVGFIGIFHVLFYVFIRRRNNPGQSTDPT